MKKAITILVMILFVTTIFFQKNDVVYANIENDDPLQARAEGNLGNGFYYDEEKKSDEPQTFSSIQPRVLADFGGNGLIHDSKFNTTTKRYGIDVSSWQGEIDWNKVKGAGVEFAIIRVGYRGYEYGALQKDSNFEKNLSGAISAGIPVGVYFFSQALNVTEGQQEAEYICNLISGYKITLPITMDYEYAGDNGTDGRLYSAHLTKEAATSAALAFCDRVKAKGYTPMVYANLDFLSNQLNASQISSRYPIWLARYSNNANYSGDYEFWQYSSVGTVNGISGNVDCDVWYDSSVNTQNATVTYSTHIQDIGWQRTISNGGISGTTGQSKRLEAIKIEETSNSNLGVKYRTHIQDVGWESTWKTDNQLSGTTGNAKRLEAIQIQLTGAEAEDYDIFYCVHAQQYGWLGWAKNGEVSGTTGQGYRLEAIKIVILPKGSSTPTRMGNYSQAYIKNYVQYKTHIQDIGWQGNVKDGAISGTTGQAKRLEAVTISLDSQEYSGNIQYRTHIQDIGWEIGWKSNGQLSGTTGQAKRLEAIQIKLTGMMSQKYDVYYRVHCQYFGWTGWAKNGQSCGSAGYSYRLEATQIKLVPKGGSAPGSASNLFYQR